MFEFLRQFSRDRFARRVKKAIKEAGGPTDWDYDPVAFVLRRPDAIANLENIYLAYRQASGEQRQRVFDNFIGAFTQRDETELSSYSAVESKITAVVRERAFLAATEGPGWGLDEATDPKLWPAQEQLTAWFSKAIVIDFPTHVAVVNQSHLKSWGMTFDEAFAVGLEKLRECTIPKFREEDGVFIGTWDDDYDSSRVLLPSLFQDLPLDGAPVITLPNRLTLMVTGSNNVNAIRAMLAKAEEIVRIQPKRQNPAPLVIRYGTLADYQVEPSSPVFHDVQRSQRMAALVTYEDQKVNLDLAYKKVGKDIFVASYKLFQTETGNFESVSVWSKDVATLLPVTDAVMFFDGSKPEAEQMVGRVNWDRVTHVLGDLMLNTKMFPARYYVSKFPTPAQLSALIE